MPKKPYSFRLDEDKVVKPLQNIIENSNGKYKDLTHLLEVLALSFIKKSK